MRIRSIAAADSIHGQFKGEERAAPLVCVYPHAVKGLLQFGVLG
jgi:hypothetical protein